MTTSFNPSRRTVLQLSSAGAMAALLAGCTDESGKTSAATNAAVTRKALTGTVVISTAFPVPKSAQDGLVTAYNKEQPNVKVTWELPGSDNYVPWLETQLAAGQIRPDIVTGFVPSDKYVDFQAWQTRLNPYTSTPWDQALTFKGLYDASGKLNLLGTRAVTVPIIYNEDLFAQAGISNPPTTWDELVAACEALRAKNITPFSANFTLNVAQWMREVYFDQYHTDWVEKVRAQKGDWNFDDDKDGSFTYDPQDPDIHDKYTFNLQRYYAGIRDGQLRFDTPAVVAYLDNMAKVFPSYAQADFATATDPYPGFLAGKGAMMANTPGALINLTKDMEKSGKSFKFGYFAMPNMTGDQIKTTQARAVESISGDYLSVIDKSAPQTEVTMDFMEFWLSRSGYDAYLKGAAQDATWSGPDGPLLIKGVQDPAPYTDAFKDLPSRGNAEASYNSLFLNWGNGQGNFRAESQQILLDTLEGKFSATDGAAKIQSYVSSNLEAILKASQLQNSDLDSPARQPGS